LQTQTEKQNSNHIQLFFPDNQPADPPERPTQNTCCTVAHSDFFLVANFFLVQLEKKKLDPYPTFFFQEHIDRQRDALHCNHANFFCNSTFFFANTDGKNKTRTTSNFFSRQPTDRPTQQTDQKRALRCRCPCLIWQTGGCVRACVRVCTSVGRREGRRRVGDCQGGR